MKPTHDAVLREMGAWNPADGGVFFAGNWPDPYSLARELLALRQAARRYLNAGEPDERGESEYALEALLPESAGAEGGEAT